MTPKISVIVPMYNVEPYIAVTIGSILNQTFGDYEVFLIDDASTDRTVKVAKSFKDRRITIIENKKNLGGTLGPGLVRNIGLERARGEFIYFMDSDDIIMQNTLELLLREIERRKADVVISTKFFSMEENEAGGEPEVLIRGGGNVDAVSKDLKQRITEEYCRQKAPVGVVYSLFRKKMLEDNNIKFRDVADHEDGVFFMDVICSTGKIVKINEPFYFYRWRKGSITRADKALDFIWFRRLVKSFLRVMEHFDDIMSAAMMREYGQVDRYFIDNACLMVKNRALVRPMADFYDADPEKCWDVIRAELDRRGELAPALMRKLTAGYFLSTLSYLDAERENFDLQTMLKDVRKLINDTIPY